MRHDNKAVVEAAAFLRKGIVAVLKKRLPEIVENRRVRRIRKKLEKNKK